MPDPNDFVDENTPEGQGKDDPKTGYPGVGGMTTEESEESYEEAAKQHFADDITHQNSPPSHHKNKSEENAKTVPQIGSIEDVQKDREENEDELDR